MNSATCPSCGVSVEATLWKDRVHAEVAMPFWASYEIHRALCLGCNTQLRRAVSSYAPAEPRIWTRNSELLRPIRDYRPHHQSGALPAQRLPTTLFWAWTPLRHSDEEGHILVRVGEHALRVGGDRRPLHEAS
jgi:hypothetical protein